MKCLTKVAIGSAAVVALIVFFFAPMVFWYTASCSGLECPVGCGGIAIQYCPKPPTYAVYESLGCATIGVGTVYSPHWFGLSFGCQVGYPFPS